MANVAEIKVAGTFRDKSYVLFCVEKWKVFSCEGAALEVLMYVCLSVCQQFEIFRFEKVQEGLRRFEKVLEGSRRFQKVPKVSRRVPVAFMELQ